MKVMPLARRLVATAPFVLAFLSTSLTTASAATPAGQIASIDPHIPVAAGQPCVVELMHDRTWPEPISSYPPVIIDPNFSYAPPSACPPPWAKVILKVHIQSSWRSVVDTLGMDLAHVRLFRSAIPHYDGTSSWSIERDLTDYSALFKAPQSGVIWSAELDDIQTLSSPTFTGSAELLFYPATPATPAPRVPDVVVAVNQDAPVALPHNIERAYLDVEDNYQSMPTNTQGNNHVFWFTCYSAHSNNLQLKDLSAFYFAPGNADYYSPYLQMEGCPGGSFRETKIGVDGTPAGIAPAFPLVVADLNRTFLPNTANEPITTLEMLNLKPYRVDLTPFAAILSTAGPHSITADNRAQVLNPDADGSRNGGTTLLLYLDKQSTQITGAVTLNTLATEHGAPTDVDTIVGDGITNQGDIKTQQQRDFQIHGFINTSHGRIDSCVHQISRFANTQAFQLESSSPRYQGPAVPELYSQTISLTSNVQQISSRRIGHWLISWDRTRIQYPLQMTYYVAGKSVFEEYVPPYETLSLLNYKVAITQRRVIDEDHYRPGVGTFTTHTDSGFHSFRKDGPAETDPDWTSFTTRDYTDNFGSCYRAKMTSSHGAITDIDRGRGCPGDHNWVVWFAHPDGSPQNAGW
jgi:hypothetical protein